MTKIKNYVTVFTMAGFFLMLVLWNVFFSDDGDFDTSYPNECVENALDNTKGTDVLGTRIKLSNQPFNEQKWASQNQKAADNNTANNKTNHKKTS